MRVRHDVGRGRVLPQEALAGETQELYHRATASALVKASAQSFGLKRLERGAAGEAHPRATQESALARLAHIKRCRAALDEEEAATVREYLRVAATDQDLLVRAEALRREAVRALYL